MRVFVCVSVRTSSLVHWHALGFQASASHPTMMSQNRSVWPWQTRSSGGDTSTPRRIPLWLYLLINLLYLYLPYTNKFYFYPHPHQDDHRHQIRKCKESISPPSNVTNSYLSLHLLYPSEGLRCWEPRILERLKGD